MSSRPAIVLVILIVSIIALCLAGVLAAMTGPFDLNLNLTDHNDSKVNLTENLTQNKTSSNYKDTGSYKSNVQTYSDSKDTSSPSSSQSKVQTVEDSSSRESSNPSTPAEPSSNVQPSNTEQST